MISADGYAGLAGLIQHFERFEFGRHVAHVIAAELPRLAREGRDDEITLIADRIREAGIKTKYVKPTAVFLIRHRMFKANTTRTALLKLEQLSADEEQYGYVFKIFESMVPKKTLIKMTPDRKAWLAHPKWSKIHKIAAPITARAVQAELLSMGKGHQ